VSKDKEIADFIVNSHIKHFFQVQVESIFLLGFGIDSGQRGLGTAEGSGWGEGRNGRKTNDEEADGNREFHLVLVNYQSVLRM
jgi:hypothetical protein